MIYYHLKELKSDLGNYQYLRAWIRELDDQIEQLEYKQSGAGALKIKSIIPGKVSAKGDPPNTVLMYMEEKDKLIKKRNEYKDRLQALDEILDHLPPKESKWADKLYREGWSYKKISVYAHYSVKQCRRRLDEALDFAMREVLMEISERCP